MLLIGEGGTEVWTEHRILLSKTWGYEDAKGELTVWYRALLAQTAPSSIR